MFSVEITYPIKYRKNVELSILILKSDLVLIGFVMEILMIIVNILTVSDYKCQKIFRDTCQQVENKLFIQEMKFKSTFSITGVWLLVFVLSVGDSKRKINFEKDT